MPQKKEVAMKDLKPKKDAKGGVARQTNRGGGQLNRGGGELNKGGGNLNKGGGKLLN